MDRIAREGVGFTDYYAQLSCTAGRAAFIGGSVPVGSGMAKVGLPGATQGWQKTDVTMATALKGQGYATGQFGKNHQGDRDEHLPTMHGFDEFLGNLYHLNAEEEPENIHYPKDPEFRKRFGPRGVLHAYANGDGTQKIEDTGPLTKKRMETVDDETSDAAIAGDPDVKERLLKGTTIKGRPYRNHIDGYNMVDDLSGKVDKSPRNEFWYGNDDGQIVAACWQDWKVVFLENRGQAFGAWREPFIELRVPLLFNLRRDPFEQAQHNSNTYNDWFLDRPFVVVPIQALAARFLQTMKDYPPSQTPGSFNLSGIEKKLREGAGGSN
ncbi:MAG: sulfatase-like hydrolase/transferase [Thiobacillus sp.]